MDLTVEQLQHFAGQLALECRIKDEYILGLQQELSALKEQQRLQDEAVSDSPHALLDARHPVKVHGRAARRSP